VSEAKREKKNYALLNQEKETDGQRDVAIRKGSEKKGEEGSPLEQR